AGTSSSFSRVQKGAPAAPPYLLPCQADWLVGIALFILELTPGVLLRQHGPQIGHVGFGLLGRNLLAGDLLGFLEAALQADNEREVLAHPAVGARRFHGGPHVLLGG